MSKPIFYQGQQVGCLMFGAGVIVEMHLKNVSVSFDGAIRDFYYDGTYDKHLRPTLYPIDQYRKIIANIPAPQPEAWKPKVVDEWCWFWDSNIYSANLGRFARYDEGRTYPYLTAIGSRWMHCAPFTGELPEHLKEVQP